MSNDSIRVALDSFSEESSQKVTINVIAPAGGKVIALLPVSEAVANLRPEVKIKRESGLLALFSTLM